MDTRRRRFIMGSAALAAVPLTLAKESFSDTSIEAASADRDGIAFSVVALGGLDPFLAVKPADDRAFRNLRPQLSNCLPPTLCADGMTLNPALVHVYELWRQRRALLAIERTGDVERSGHSSACLRLRAAMCGQGNATPRLWEPGLHVSTRSGWTRLAWNAHGLLDPRQSCGRALTRCLTSLVETLQPLRIIATVPGFDWHRDAHSFQAGALASLNRLVAAAHTALSNLALPSVIDVCSELGRSPTENALRGSDHGDYALRIRIGPMQESVHRESVELLRAKMDTLGSV